MKKVIPILVLACLAACKNNPKVEKMAFAQEEVSVKTTMGKVVVVMEGSKYETEVNCLYFGEDHFTFLSDKNQMQDTNHDGLIINGFQTGKKMEISINIDGVYYSAGGSFDLLKEGNIAKGKGLLFHEDTAEGFESSFEVVCN